PAGGPVDQSSSAFRLIDAPQVQVIQTRSPSTPPSRSPQYWCSWKKAWSASKSVTPRWSSTGLFNDLVGAQQQRLRNRQAQRLGGLEIDHQLELGGLLDWEISGLGAFEDLVHVTCGTPK